MSNNREIVIAASALSLVLAHQAQAQQPGAGERTGVAGFVRGSVQTIDNRGQAVRVRVGDAIFQDQRIVTDGRSRMQIMLLDKSMVTIGPDADLRFDRYEYDRASGAGSMAMTAAKGLFRFVGGLLSKRNPVQVRTPTATIGIRGAIVFLQMQPDGGVRLTFFYGNEATITPDGGEPLSINRPGFFVDLSGAGDTETGRLSPQQIAALAAQLEGTGETVQVAESVASDAPSTVIDLDADALANLDLKAIEEAIQSSDIDFDQLRETLEEISAGLAGSGGGGISLGPL